jgi:hypothetical protein
MNGLRHCTSAIKNDDGCIDRCFQGVLWREALGAAATTFGGPQTAIPDALRQWLTLKDNTSKCTDIVNIGPSAEPPLDTTCDVRLTPASVDTMPAPIAPVTDAPATPTPVERTLSPAPATDAHVTSPNHSKNSSRSSQCNSFFEIHLTRNFLRTSPHPLS